MTKQRKKFYDRQSAERTKLESELSTILPVHLAIRKITSDSVLPIIICRCVICTTPNLKPTNAPKTSTYLSQGNVDNQSFIREKDCCPDSYDLCLCLDYVVVRQFLRCFMHLLEEILYL